MLRKFSVTLFLLCCCFSFIFGQKIVNHKHEQPITNIAAFTKLYGYVKYFHPSDEASNIDFEKFAVLGVEKVKKAKDDFELQKILQELFIPIAPTIQIYKSNEKPKDLFSFYTKDTSNLEIIAWQHFGVELNKRSNKYKSVRIGRNQNSKYTETRPAFGSTTQSIDAVNYAGRDIKLQAFVKADVEKLGNQGQLWLRVDRKNKELGFFDNMDDRPIISSNWEKYEIMGSVAEDAERIVFGCFLRGAGKIWVDEVELLYKNDEGNWESIEIDNPGFEKPLSKDINKQTWWYGSPGYSYQLITGGSYKGEKSLLIENASKRKLFDRYPKADEVIKKQLTDNLYCKIPLALFSDSMSTLGKNENFPFSPLAEQLDQISIYSLKADNENIRLADIVITWNVFKHFYPYFDVVDVNWNNVLTETLEEALEDKTSDEFYDTLSKMVAKLQDGHGYVYYKRVNELGGLPIRVEWIENQCVITATEDSLFQKGDIIKSIDGTEAEKYLIEREKYVSGSPQLRRYRALNQFGSGELGSKAILQILRNNHELKLEITREREKRGFFFNPLSEFDFPHIKEIEKGIYYVNLQATSEEEFNSSINELAVAKGIVFDTRWDGEFKKDVKRINMFNIVAHLIEFTVNSPNWLIPNIIYPDQDSLEFTESQWQIHPQSPFLNSKVVFIVDAPVVSSGETFMGIIEQYQLADIVGGQTAGTNGNANYILLPGGFQIMWTGMKVLKHDRSQHHLIGITPTYPVKKTIKAVKEGRDEYLEEAIEVIKQK